MPCVARNSHARLLRPPDLQITYAGPVTLKCVEPIGHGGQRHELGAGDVGLVVLGGLTHVDQAGVWQQLLELVDRDLLDGMRPNLARYQADRLGC